MSPKRLVPGSLRYLSIDLESRSRSSYRGKVARYVRILEKRSSCFYILALAFGLRRDYSILGLDLDLDHYLES